MEKPTSDQLQLRWSHPFILELINTLPGAQIFVLTENTPTPLDAEDTPDRSREEVHDPPADFSGGFLPHHLDNDIYWDDGSL